MDFYLGIDFGTSSVKTTLIDNKGYIVYQSKSPITILNPRPNFYEIDPIKSWWKKFLEICRNLQKKVNLKEIKAICISSTCGTFVPVDEHLNPVYNAILYGIDSRSIEQVKRLNKKYSKEFLYMKLGGIFDTHSIIPKILWLKENFPNIYNSTRYFVESNNFLTSRLTGIIKWDYPTASGAKLVDLQTFEKPEDILEELEIESYKIPEFKWPTEILGEIDNKGERLTGLKRGVKIITGACDINAEAIAIGAIKPGDFIMVLGSTISVLFTIDTPVILEGFITGISIFKNHYRIGGATSSGGRFLEWIREFYNIPKEIKISKYIQRPSGIFILPYIDGARIPYNNPLISVLTSGIRKSTSKEEILLASYESLGYELALILDKIKLKTKIPNVLYVTGGLVNNIDLLTTISDITGKTLKIYKNIDASYGDALLAMSIDLSLDEIYKLPGVQNLQNSAIHISPNSEVHMKYISFISKFIELCDFANLHNF
jgi:xylulokinase